MKKRQIAYWVTTALTAFVFLSGGVMDIVQPADVIKGMTDLGYPVYFTTLLGVWKILGGIAVLAPGFPRLKEWAYAGMLFDLRQIGPGDARRGHRNRSGAAVILVAGATGNVGGALVRALADQGVPVRALTRRAAPGDSPWSDEVEVAVGDLDDPASLADALSGVRGLFLLSGYQGTAELLATGKEAGLERAVVLGSGAVADADVHAPKPSTNVIVAYNVETERIVRASGLDWTVLRPTGFQSNALRWLPQLASGDVVRGPWGDIPIAAIDPADIAAVAAVALTAGDHDGQALHLTGPEAHTPAERVAILGEVLNRPLRFEGQDDATARAEMLLTTPPEYVDAFFRLFSGGETDETTVHPTVEQVLGRPPGSFERWVSQNAGAFR